MSATDPPAVNIKKAIKKLRDVQRNIMQAGNPGNLWRQCVALREALVKEYEKLGTWEEWDGQSH